MRDNEIRLRAVEPSDAPWLYEVEGDSASWVCSDTTAPVSMHMLQEYCRDYDADPFRAGQLRLIAVGPDGGRIGVADLYRISAKDRSAFAGIYVSVESRGRGCGRAIVKLLSDYALRVLCLHNLVALVTSGNDESASVFEDSGYIRTATLRDWRRIDGRYHDVDVYQLIDNK